MHALLYVAGALALLGSIQAQVTSPSTSTTTARSFNFSHPLANSTHPGALHAEGHGHVNGSTKHLYGEGGASVGHPKGGVPKVATKGYVPLPTGTVISVSHGTSYFLVFNKDNNTLPGQMNHWVIPISDKYTAGINANGSGSVVTDFRGALFSVRPGTTSVLISDNQVFESTNLHGALPAMQSILPYEVPIEQSPGQFGEQATKTAAAVVTQTVVTQTAASMPPGN